MGSVARYVFFSSNFEKNHKDNQLSNGIVIICDVLW